MSTPKWAIDLAIRLEKWEDEHPSTCECDGVSARKLCLQQLQDLIPESVQTEARAVAAYLNERAK